jgi:hypothetical protein
MKKPLVLGLIALALLIVGLVIAKQLLKSKDKVTIVEEEEIVLPVNVIPIEERPFVTLKPDSSGRYLNLGIDKLVTPEKTMEYELVYQTIEGDQGAFGRINLLTEKQPIDKPLLLGSKSAGGAVTYYPGVSGGTIALTWGETKIKESFNFLRFDPKDPAITSVDGRLSYVFSATSFKKDDVVVTMKTSGYPVSLPSETDKLLAGPYAVLTPTLPKGKIQSFEIMLPAGEHLDPTIYQYLKGEWVELKTTLDSDKVKATPTVSAQSIFVVLGQ